MDQKTLAYVNLYGVLGALPRLCELDPAAANLVRLKKPFKLGFRVKGGPEATLVFENGSCHMVDGAAECDMRLSFATPEKFNGMINGTVTPFPLKGLHHVFFLLKRFTKLTDLLGKYLKAAPDALKDETFFTVSTELMFRVIAQSVAQIGNHDKIGMFSASNIVDGDVELSVEGGPAATLRVKDHALTAVFEKPENPRAIMHFTSLRLARQLFDGQVNAVACIGRGEIEMRGMISMIDNINRILDRVAVYLS
jgi:hypothetical protein